MGEQQMQAAAFSPVAHDQIRKDTIEKVTKNQIFTWPSRWNWLIDENVKMYEAMAGKRPLSPLVPGKVPKSVDMRKKDKNGRKLDVILPPIPDIPAQSTLPITTNGWYGFKPKLNGRSVVSDRQKWCRVTVGQHNLCTLLGLPEILD